MDSILQRTIDVCGTIVAASCRFENCSSTVATIKDVPGVSKKQYRWWAINSVSSRSPQLQWQSYCIKLTDKQATGNRITATGDPYNCCTAPIDELNRFNALKRTPVEFSLSLSHPNSANQPLSLLHTTPCPAK